MEIVELGLEHEEALQDFLADFARAGEKEIHAYFASTGWSHREIVETFARWSRGEGLGPGWVPGTTLFLADEGRLLAVANLRHTLTEALRSYGGHVGYSVRPSERNKGYARRLLEGVKERAQKTGISRLLLTCNEENIPSIRVIESCGGRLLGTVTHPPTGEQIRRYWIETAQKAKTTATTRTGSAELNR